MTILSFIRCIAPPAQNQVTQAELEHKLHAYTTAVSIRLTTSTMMIVTPERAFSCGFEIIGDGMAAQGSKGFVKFVSIYGCPPEDVSAAWNMIERSPPEGARKNRALKHLLWALALLRNYSTEIFNSRLFDCNEDTWRYWTRIYVKALSKLSFKVIKWSNRFVNCKFKEFNVTVDGVDFHAPDNHEVRDKSLYSHKFNGAGWRYEIATAVGSGHIVSIVGPFKAGAANDLAIYRQVTKKFLVTGEKVLADRGYRGDETVLTNYDDGISHVEKAIRGRLLANHERVNGQLKKWACLNVKVSS